MHINIKYLHKFLKNQFIYVYLTFKCFFNMLNKIVLLYISGTTNDVILMSHWEVMFLKAEAALRYGTADNVKTKT